MDDAFLIEFKCDCGRTHKARLTRENTEGLADAVDRRMYLMSSTVATPSLLGFSGPRTIEPSQPGPDTIRNDR